LVATKRADGDYATSKRLIMEKISRSARCFRNRNLRVSKSFLAAHRCDLGVESRKGARPGPTGSRLFPFPAHQTGRAQLEHPAFRLVSPQRPRKRTDNTAPCHGTPATLPSRCGNSWMGSIRNHSGFQTFVNDRSVALSPAHQKQGPFPPPTLLGLHGYMTLSDFRAGHHPIGDV
jgi:hypothetical protein